MGRDIRAHPVGESLVLALGRFELGRESRQRLVRRRREISADARDLLLGQAQDAVLVELRVFLLHHRGEFFRRELVDENFYARLVEIVAPAELVIGAHDGFEIGQKLVARQARADAIADHGRAALSAAGPDVEDGRAVRVLPNDHADVVHLDRRAVVGRARHRDLEFPRQEREFRMQGRPLADDLGPNARILHLVGRHAGILVRRDVSNAIAARLQAVHLDAGELGQDIGHLGQLDPMELQVLARGEVAVALVVAARDLGQLAHLARGQRAVGNGDAQHVGVELQIESVHQPERAELFVRELARDAAQDLVAELRHALVHQRRVEFVVPIHRASASNLLGARCPGCPEQVRA